MINRRHFLKSIGLWGTATLPFLPCHGCATPVKVTKDMSLKQLEQAAHENLRRHRNCAQATFATLDDYYGLDGARVFKALTPFPGIAHRGETCGGVSGAMTALGLIYGKDKNGNLMQMKKAGIISGEFCRRFAEARGSINCREILMIHTGQPIDLSRAEGRKLYDQCNGITVCRSSVSAGVRIAVEIIRENPV